MNAWGFFVFLAGVTVLLGGRRLAPLRGLKPEVVDWLWPALMAGGVLGAHLYYLAAVVHWPFQPAPLGQLLNPFGGTAVQGGVLGGIAAAWIFTRLAGVEFFALCDALAPAGALAQGIARIGCFFAGCCYGRECALYRGIGLDRHPAQLYETVLDALLGWFLYRRLLEERTQGKVFALYVAGYGAIRFVLQFFRDDDAGHLVAGLAHSQFLAAAMLAAAAALYLRLKETPWTPERSGS